MLHVIKSSPFTTRHFDECLTYIQADDAILFIQDGVIATATMHKYAMCLLALDNSIKIYTLSEDLSARGLACQIGSNVDYTGFVGLTCEHRQLQTWG